MVIILRMTATITTFAILLAPLRRLRNDLSTGFQFPVSFGDRLSFLKKARGNFRQRAKLRSFELSFLRNHLADILSTPKPGKN